MIDEALASEWKWHRTSVLLKDGTWLHDLEGNRIEIREQGQEFWSETHPYRNVTQNGREQLCNATIQVWEREWRWNGVSKIDKDIDVSFDKELGREAGSWKGGVVGCSYEIKEGETPLQTLRRMEKERQFK